jgi:hypothetical protein
MRAEPTRVANTSASRILSAACINCHYRDWLRGGWRAAVGCFSRDRSHLAVARDPALEGGPPRRRARRLARAWQPRGVDAVRSFRCAAAGVLLLAEQDTRTGALGWAYLLAVEFHRAGPRRALRHRSRPRAASTPQLRSSTSPPASRGASARWRGGAPTGQLGVAEPQDVRVARRAGNVGATRRGPHLPPRPRCRGPGRRRVHRVSRHARGRADVGRTEEDRHHIRRAALARPRRPNRCRLRQGQVPRSGRHPVCGDFVAMCAASQHAQS